MLIRGSNYMGISKNSNSVYWDQDLYPAWAAIRGVHGSSTQGPGTGRSLTIMTVTSSGFSRPDAVRVGLMGGVLRLPPIRQCIHPWASFTDSRCS